MHMDVSGLDTALVVIAAVIMAINQGFRDADHVRKSLPNWLKSPRWNYVPATLVAVAAIVFVCGKIFPASPLPPDPKLQAEVDGLRDNLASILDEKPFKIPAGFSNAGSTIRFVHAPTMGYVTLVDPAKHPDLQLELQIDQNSSNPAVQGLLKGTFFHIPKGYPFAGQVAAVVPKSLTKLDERPGPGFVFKNVGDIKGSDWGCEGHTPCTSVEKAKSFDVDKLKAK